jgi:hypothetical protein
MELNKFKHVVFLLTLSLLFASCEDFDGVMHVSDTIALKGKKSTMHLTPGAHAAKLQIKSKKKLKLHVKSNGLSQSITIKLAQKLNIPTYNGEFEVPAGVSGLSVDLQGSVKNNVRSSGDIRDVEYCTIYHTVPKCHKECKVVTEIKIDPRGNKHEVKRNVCHDVCQRVRVSIPGHKKVVYHYNTHEKMIDLMAYDLESGQLVATFKGDNSYVTGRIYTFQSLCMKR